MKTRTNIAWVLMVNLIIGLITVYSVVKYEIASPWWLLMLLFLPVLSFYYVWKKESFYGTLNLSSESHLVSGILQKAPDLMKILTLSAIALSIIAMSRPQENMVPKDISKEGIDIILALDLSLSMLAKDFEPDRLEASKRVAKKFVLDRQNDRIGIVTYAGESFPLVPLTSDNLLVANAIENIRYGKLQDGTAIGLGLASSVNRLKDSETKSKVIILLSDGENNPGTLNPLDASELANVYGITVYTIGVGSEGTAMAPGLGRNGQIIFKEMPVSIDERTLYEVAANTGGKYFRATNEQELLEIYEIIDQLEKTKFEATIIKQKAEAHWKFLSLALVLISIVFFLRMFVLKSLFS